MEWVNLCIELIGHIAWPASIFGLALIFRSQVKGLLRAEEVESIEAGPGGVKLTRRKIGEELSVVRSKIEASEWQLDAHKLPAEESSAAGLGDRVKKIVEIDPPAAVFASAAHFESTLRERLIELDRRQDGPHSNFRPMRQSIELARKHGILTDDQAEAAVRLNEMRNQIAHEYQHVDLDKEQAIEFCELARELEVEIELNQNRRA